MENKDINIQAIMDDPMLGRGRLYYEVFWMYDVLVVPVKTHDRAKVKYGTVQRMTSQTRSGVPVLIEINGYVTENFMEKYNYSCAFSETETMHDTRRYWTFREAVEAMKSEDLRKKCQEEASKISSEFSTQKMAQKLARTLVYGGEFQC